MSKGQLTPAILMGKAEVALSSAKALLERGDTDGAVNRAYYAMFDAARAALLLAAPGVSPEISRTHSGLIAAFGNHLVKAGPIPKTMGRLLNRAHEIRQLADYTGDSIKAADAAEVIEQATAFVTLLQETF